MDENWDFNIYFFFARWQFTYCVLCSREAKASSANKLKLYLQPIWSIFSCEMNLNWACNYIFAIKDPPVYFFILFFISIANSLISSYNFEIKRRRAIKRTRLMNAKVSVMDLNYCTTLTLSMPFWNLLNQNFFKYIITEKFLKFKY